MLFRRTETMTPAEAAAAARDGAILLVDVRNPSEVSEARIDGAVHIPLHQLPGRIGGLPRDRRVAFLCRSGHRSAIAARAASKAGVHAVNISGGMNAWRRARLPVSIAVMTGDGT